MEIHISLAEAPRNRKSQRQVGYCECPCCIRIGNRLSKLHHFATLSKGILPDFVPDCQLDVLVYLLEQIFNASDFVLRLDHSLSHHLVLLLFEIFRQVLLSDFLLKLVALILALLQG